LDECEALGKIGYEGPVYDGGLGSRKPVMTILHQQQSAVPDLDLSNDLFDLFANLKHPGQTISNIEEQIGALTSDEECPNKLRVFSGHIRWSRGALAAQVEEGLWFPCAVSPSILFSQRSPGSLWNEVWALMREWCEQHIPEGTAPEASEESA